MKSNFRFIEFSLPQKISQTKEVEEVYILYSVFVDENSTMNGPLEIKRSTCARSNTLSANFSAHTNTQTHTNSPFHWRTAAAKKLERIIPLPTLFIYAVIFS